MSRYKPFDFSSFLNLKNLFLLGAVLVCLFCFSYFSLSKKEHPVLLSKFKIDDFYLSSQNVIKMETFLKTLSSDLIQNNTLTALSSPSLIFLETYGALTEETGSFMGERREPFEYVVEKGDTISSIAEMFNISEETILWANDLTKNSKLKEDQRLLILPTSGLVHIVSSSETISGIAKKYKTSVSKIIAFNELSEDDKIYKGDVLIIPDGIMPPPPKVFKPQTVSLPGSYFMASTYGVISQGLHWYNAVDIANQCDITPVVAAAEGKVIQVGWQNACGKLIKIEHPNGVVTVYCHLSSIFVNTGNYVSRGQEIGRVGNTGRTRGSTGCHLHFSVVGAKNPLTGYSRGTRIIW